MGDSFDSTLFWLQLETVWKKKHNVKYLLNQVFGKQVKVFVLNSKTKSASETVFRTIKNFKLKGQVIVKDSDSCFNLDKKFKYLNTNFIAGVDISEHPEVHNIHQKSFLRLNNKNQIIDMEEKKIISDKILKRLYKI